MIDNHRKFIRFNCMLLGKARLQNKAIKNARVKNFSRTGMLLTLPDSNDNLNGCVEVRLNIPGRILPVYISGKIMWKQNVKEHCEVGVEIDEAERTGKSEIMDYVYSAWQRRKRNEKYEPTRLQRNH